MNIDNHFKVVKKTFYRQHLKILGIYLVFLILFIICFGLINHFFPEVRSEIIGIIVLGVLIIAFFIFLFSIIKELIVLMIGPSKANRTPEKTIRKYYCYCLIAYGSINLSKVQVEALNFLSQEAILKISGWEGFNKYWTQTNLDILNDFRSRFNFDQSRFQLGKINILNQTNDLIDFEINIEFIGKYGLGTSQNRINTYDLGTYTVTNQVKKINDYWYITNSEWNGQLL